MKRWTVVVSAVLLASVVFVMCWPVVHAQGPDLDRCTEYLYPYTPVEWERCVGDEFNKFPTAPTGLREAYVRAPATGHWPEPQVIELGAGAPRLNFPATDWNGQVYIAPPDSQAYSAPLIGSPAPDVDYWWQQPATAQPDMPQVDLYTAWQNYWLSGGATPNVGWESPQLYDAPGR